MSYRFKIIAFCLLILVAAAAIFAWVVIDNDSIDNDSSFDSNSESTSTSASDEVSTGVSTFKDLLSTPESMECTITYQNEIANKAVYGNLFTKGGKVRGDFVQTDTELGTIVTTYIITDSSLHVWSEIDGVNYGARYDIGLIESANLPISQNENVRYSCMNWTQTDDSMFEPPADILFKNAAEANVEYGTVYEEGEF